MTIYRFPTTSTADAMRVLNEYRSRIIAAGKIIAEYLCRVHGTTHSRAITAEMDRRGLLRRDVPGFWVGAVLRDERFVNTGKVVLPPLSAGARSHDPRLIWLWRLKESGVAPLILWEYTEYSNQRPAPTPTQRVLFILRHITITKTPSGWCGLTRFLDDEHTRVIRQNPYAYSDWINLFLNLKNINARTRTEARARVKALVTAFVADH